MSAVLADIKRRHKRVVWGCETCAEYCDVLPVLDEVKRLRAALKADHPTPSSDEQPEPARLPSTPHTDPA